MGWTSCRPMGSARATMLGLAMVSGGCDALIGLEGPTKETTDASKEDARAATHDSGRDDAGAGDFGRHDATVDADAAWVEAPHPSQPQIIDIHQFVPLPSSPTIVPITFTSYPFAADVNALVSQLNAAHYWDVLGEYGVTVVNSGAPLAGGDAPTTVTDTDVQAFLTQMFTGDAGAPAAFGTPSASSVYMLYYPTGTTVNPFGETGCVDLQAYHSDFLLGGVDVAYAVVLDCSSGEDGIFNSASAEMLSALTDPDNTSTPRYAELNVDYLAWEQTGDAIEVGSLAVITTTDDSVMLGGVAFPVARAWSNKSALAGHDPAVPADPAAGPYFNSAPVLNDAIHGQFFPGSAAAYPTTGVHIPVGQSGVIDVDLFSDGPTAPWTVTAQTIEQMTGTGDGDLTFSFDRSTGVNGDVLHLTITVASNPATNGQVFVLSSTLGAITHYWYGAVGN
jgi:hypothetical protein